MNTNMERKKSGKHGLFNLQTQRTEATRNSRKIQKESNTNLAGSLSQSLSLTEGGPDSHVIKPKKGS